MPACLVLEAEVERRRKISARLKGVPKKHPRKPLSGETRAKISEMNRLRWAGFSADRRAEIGDKISVTRLGVSKVEDDLTVKRCTKCLRAYPKTSVYFSEDSRNRDGLFGVCRTCHTEAVKEWLKNNPERRLQFRRNRYNIDFEGLWEAQKGLCAVCGGPIQLSGKGSKSVCIDHDHNCCPSLGKSCGKCVRGLVHQRCNLLLGHAKDEPDILIKAAAYLSARRDFK